MIIFKLIAGFAFLLWLVLVYAMIYTQFSMDSWVSLLEVTIAGIFTAKIVGGLLELENGPNS